jgi:hypothetical protein
VSTLSFSELVVKTSFKSIAVALLLSIFSQSTTDGYSSTSFQLMDFSSFAAIPFEGICLSKH